MLSVISGIVLFRVLTPADFGVYALALAVLNVLLSFNELGLDMAVVRWPGDVSRAQHTAVSMAIGSSIFWYIACFLAAPEVAALAHRPEATGPLRLVATVVLVDGIVAIPRARLYRALQQRQIGTGEILAVVVNVTVSIVLVVLGARSWGPAAGTVGGALVNGAVIWCLAPARPRPGFHPVDARRLLAFGLPGAGTMLVEMMLLNVDTLIVANRLGATALGFYALAFNISSWPSTLITTAVRKVALPAFSRMSVSTEALGEGANRSIGLLVSLLIPVCLLMSVLAQPLVRFLYSAKSLPAAQVLAWLAVLGGVRVVMNLVVDMLMGMGLPRISLRGNAIWLLVAAPAMLLGAEVGGIRGVAVAHVAAACAVAAPLFLVAARRAGVHIRVVGVRRAREVAGVVLGALLGIVTVHRVHPPLPALALGGLVTMLGYLPLAITRHQLQWAWTRLSRSRVAEPGAPGDPAGPAAPPGDITHAVVDIAQERSPSWR
jgi:PST family polysaccharide transporter